MQHITDILVFSNRCEVVNEHIFATRDKGLPHIRLKFKYMFEESSLHGKTLECKYLLPNGKYLAEIVIINSTNEVIFPIHYSCFTVNGWTTLRITLINDDNRVTLDDIIIKTKETKLGEKFNNIKVENAILDKINTTTQSIKTEGDNIKEELRNYISQEKIKLKGERGESGYSAYEIAKVHGFIGTIEEWLNSLKAEKGRSGLNLKTIFEGEARLVNGESIEINEDWKIIAITYGNFTDLSNSDLAPKLDFFTKKDCILTKEMQWGNVDVKITPNRISGVSINWDKEKNKVLVDTNKEGLQIPITKVEVLV